MSMFKLADILITQLIEVDTEDKGWKCRVAEIFYDVPLFLFEHMTRHPEKVRDAGLWHPKLQQVAKRRDLFRGLSRGYQRGIL